ncbi:MAG: hypothetical protein HKN11_02560 [Rhizobiales bacterium]|nr:hypothetical protein [Hyphomicrobiales bacterium]
MIERQNVLPEPDLPGTGDLVAEGKRLAKDWQVAPGAFLTETGCQSEADYKRAAIADGRIMQHAQIGYRDPGKSCRAWREIYETCAGRGVNVDRYGICLDWSMGVPRDERNAAQLGTGLILQAPEDFARLTDQAPVAPHFGDFVMGFPAAVENTQAALAAGATSIGNLGQYFTFRLPGHDDDIAATEATVTALALCAAQPVEVLVHSNLDDGFAGLFLDLSSALGAVLLEKHIVETLINATASHCWGHHFTDPKRRLAFHLALARITDTPGTMIYGNTVAYQGSDAENYASLASYLLTDIAGQRLQPTGHAINPVPVRENERIPDIDEVIEAQLFAARLGEHADGYAGLINPEEADELADRILEGGRRFFDNVMKGLSDAGIDTQDAFELLLAIRRIGGKQLEQLYGAGKADDTAPGGCQPIVQSSLVEDLNELAGKHVRRIGEADSRRIAQARPRVMVAASDVHEHGKLALEQVLRSVGAEPLDGGVSVDAEVLARDAVKADAEAIMVSTYNGIALDYYRLLKTALTAEGSAIPVLIGGRTNQIPQGSNTSLPVDVTRELMAEGAIVCGTIEDAVPALLTIMEDKQ